MKHPRDTPPTSLSIVSQRTTGDCAVACLAMLLGLSYEQTVMAFRGSVEEDGANMRQIQNAARRLHHRLRWTSKVDLETSVGILWVNSQQWTDPDHVVVLKEGQINNTDDTQWDADVYLSVYAATVVGLLVLVESR